MTTNPAIPQAIERAAEALKEKWPSLFVDLTDDQRRHAATIVLTTALAKPCSECGPCNCDGEGCNGDGYELEDPRTCDYCFALDAEWPCPRDPAAPCEECSGSGFRSLLLVDTEGLRERLIALAKKWPMTVPDDWQGREVEQQRKADIILALLQEEAS